MEAGIEVIGLRKRYGDSLALDDVTFTVPRGQVCGYLGPNGAGKSTTLKSLAGVIKPDGGVIRLDGKELVGDGVDAKQTLGFVPESVALYSLLSTREHLTLVADLHELPEESLGEKIDELIGLFELQKVANRPIETLSKGQKQKALLACALLPDPSVLLLDEPLSGLDVQSALQLKELIAGLAERGRTILFSSHILDVVERVCDRAIILDKGRIVADAPTEELLQQSRDGSLESVFRSLVRSADIGLADAFLGKVAPTKSRGTK